MTGNALVKHKVRHCDTISLKGMEFLERQHSPDTNFAKMISQIKNSRKK